jgi:putative addiction module component (TIGR02574 family)
MSTVPVADLLRLSIAERIELVQVLWESVAEEANADPSRLPMTEPQRNLVRSRTEECRQNPSAAFPLEEALERIERSLD